MKFTFSESKARAPELRVIPEIPNYALCHLEGSNGIGKSVAARLLELATGAQPYLASPNAWRTLREQLGETRITVSEFPDGSELIFDLDPTSWPEFPDGPLGDNLGTVFLNGALTSIDDARRLLRVRRISGDESLVQTLARELAERAVSALSTARKLRPVAEKWQLELAALVSLVGTSSRSELLRLVTVVKDATLAAASAQNTWNRAATTVDRLAASSDALEASLRRRTLLPDLLTQLDDGSRRLAAASQNLTKASKAAEQAAVALAASGEVRDAIARWEHLRTLRQRAAQRAEIQERHLLRELGYEGRPHNLNAELARARRDLAAKLARRDAIDLITPLRTLATRVENDLAPDVPRLGGEVIADLDPPATVRDLLVAVQSRRSHLAGQPKPDDVAKLERAVLHADRRVQLLSALIDAAQVVDRKRTNLRDAETTLNDLFKQLGQADRAAYEEAQQRAEEARDDFVAAELRVREVRKAIAELLEVAPLTPQVVGTATEHTTSEDDDADGDEAGEDLLYPELARDQAEALARTKDEHALAALAGLDWRDIAAVLGEPAIELDPRSQLLIAFLEGNQTAAVDAAADAARWLRDLHVSAKAVLVEYESRALHAADIRDNARQGLLDARRAVHRAHVELSAADRSWSDWAIAARPLFAAAGATQPVAPAGDDVSAEELNAADALDTVRAIASAQEVVALDVVSRLEAVSGYLHAQAARLAPQVAFLSSGLGATAATDYFGGVSERLREWAQDELASLLVAPELLTELFDEATSVQVDLDDAMVTWHPREGGVKKRPLEAFSSGEQVFAYTRATLAQLAKERASVSHLVIFLDEFGAFVARDRLGQLMRFVEHGAVGTVADQVIVMLPLARDYVARMRDVQLDPRVDGPRSADSHAARAEQVRARGYFAVPFSSGRAHLT